jgi:hypothetical protein
MIPFKHTLGQSTKPLPLSNLNELLDTKSQSNKRSGKLNFKVHPFPFLTKISGKDKKDARLLECAWKSNVKAHFFVLFEVIIERR